MIVIGNGLDLGNGVSRGSLTMSRMAQRYDLDLGWLCWLFSIDLDRTPSTLSRNNKWQIYPKALLV